MELSIGVRNGNMLYCIYMSSKADDTLNNKTAWMSFIVNKYADAKKMNNTEAFYYLYNTKALEYLDECYEVEHLENPIWTIENIDIFIENHKGDK
jgi:hypothetical protein